MERGFLILAACGVICTDECFFWKVFWWPICCLDREAGNFNFFFAGCGFGSRSFLKDTKPLLSAGQLHQPQLPAALPRGQAHQAPPPGLHHPHPALDIRAVLQGEPWECGRQGGDLGRGSCLAHLEHLPVRIHELPLPWNGLSAPLRRDYRNSGVIQKRGLVSTAQPQEY